jgi:hypothetical protein
MYGYAEDYIVPITIENILMRISQEDIFYSMLGEYPNINKNYKSLVRTDNNPGCNFVWYNDKLIFLDFAYPKTHLDCFGVISERMKISLPKALVVVNNHFKLGLGGTGTPTKIKFKPFSKKVSKKQTTSIIFKPRKFNLLDKAYWSQYGITKQNLIDEKVYPILWYKFYSKKLKKVILIRPRLITYAYYEFQPLIKIYSPYSPKKKGKWISNVSENDIGGIRTLPVYGDKLLITKSLKDSRCIKNFGINTVWFQSEGSYPTTEILIPLLNRFNEYIILFDNDKQGIKASEYLTRLINSHYPNKCRNVQIPTYHNITDITEFYKYKGKIEVLKFLTINNII